MEKPNCEEKTDRRIKQKTVKSKIDFSVVHDIIVSRIHVKSNLKI